MNSFGTFLVSFVLMFVVASNVEKTQGAFEPTQVKIQADIPGESVKAHCYASDSHTDFGNKVLNYGQNFIIRFRTKPFGLTKFYCDFNTNHGSGNYGVFTQHLSEFYCGFACAWYVRRDGPCVIDTAGKPYCQNWKKPPAAANV